MAQPRRHKKKARRQAPKRSDVLEINLIGAQGDGVAIQDGDEIFVPYTAPGDVVEAEVWGNRGRIVSINEKSPSRIDPVCRHFGACGGCALQHINEEAYWQWNRDLVVSSLEREGFDPSIVQPLIACAPQTRRRAAFAVKKTKRDFSFGFVRRRSHDVENIEECHILHPDVYARLEGLKRFAITVAESFPTFTLLVTLCDNGLDVVITGDADIFDLGASAHPELVSLAQETGFARVTIGDEPLVAFDQPSLTFGAVTVSPPPGGFLQASREGEAALVRLVMEAASGAKKVADLFCGAGTFAGPLASEAAVDAYDADEKAIAALDAGARVASGLHPLTAHRRNLFLSPLLAKELKPYDAVVFDPPRAGAEAQTREIAHSLVPKVIGVSCNPRSFARDAAILRDGGYDLTSVTPVDQFVYAAHVELVGVFEKGA